MKAATPLIWALGRRGRLDRADGSQADPALGRAAVEREKRTDVVGDSTTALGSLAPQATLNDFTATTAWQPSADDRIWLVPRSRWFFWVASLSSGHEGRHGRKHGQSCEQHEGFFLSAGRVGERRSGEWRDC